MSSFFLKDKILKSPSNLNSALQDSTYLLYPAC